mmetsp:Transcript_27299/g.59629  ORF Transcript_27299/g.59629 Transcript_27299/m.59629 type:complete len:205 (+) Transcript_27299:229-843(+)
MMFSPTGLVGTYSSCVLDGGNVGGGCLSSGLANQVTLLLVHFEERIRKSQSVHPLHLGVKCKLRVHVEEDRHVHLLARLQALLLEAEALDLVEVGPRLHGGDVVGAHAGDGGVAQVLCAEEGQHRLPRHAPHLALAGAELPLHAVAHVRVEGDLQLPVRHDARGGLVHLLRVEQLLLHALHPPGGASVPGGLTEHPVQRHGGVR